MYDVEEEALISFLLGTYLISSTTDLNVKENYQTVLAHLDSHTLDKEDYHRISEALSFLMPVVEKHYDKEGQRIAISALMHSLTLQQ